MFYVNYLSKTFIIININFQLNAKNHYQDGLYRYFEVNVGERKHKLSELPQPNSSACGLHQ